MDSSQVAPAFTGTGDIHKFVETREEPDWMLDIRRAALRRFAAMEWPSPQEEEWRRSDIRNLGFDSYTFAGATVPRTSRSTPPAGTAGLIEFDGPESGQVSLAPELEQRGVVFAPLAELLRELRAGEAISEKAVAALRRLLEEGASRDENRMYPLHYSAWTHGVLLYVPPSLIVEEPFVVRFNEAGDGRMSLPHVVCAVGQGADATLVQQVRGTEEEGEIFLSDGVDLEVGDGGRLEFFARHDLNIDSSTVGNGIARIGRDAHLHHFLSSFGGMFAKFRTDVILQGQGADALIDGVYFAREDQHMDMRTVQDHRGSNTGSRTFYKGAVKDEARSVYQGLIKVDHEAPQTDAYLTNNNLILNDGARSDSIPSLQINNDDVKCSHGSTTGRIDERQLFYLLTRGYSPREARIMLVQGFFEAVITRAPASVREALREEVERRMRVTEGDEE
ncbi:MAG: Fe-S cluster assembly protein SufD [Spirochaetaceae bacterium]